MKSLARTAATYSASRGFRIFLACPSLVAVWLEFQQLFENNTCPAPQASRLVLDGPHRQHRRHHLQESLLAPLLLVVAPSGRIVVRDLHKVHRDHSIATRGTAGVALSLFLLLTLLSIGRLCVFGDAAMPALWLGPHHIICNPAQLVFSSVASSCTVCIGIVCSCCSRPLTWSQCPSLHCLSSRTSLGRCALWNKLQYTSGSATCV